MHAEANTAVAKCFKADDCGSLQCVRMPFVDNTQCTHLSVCVRQMIYVETLFTFEPYVVREFGGRRSFSRVTNEIR